MSSFAGQSNPNRQSLVLPLTFTLGLLAFFLADSVPKLDPVLCFFLTFLISLTVFGFFMAMNTHRDRNRKQQQDLAAFEKSLTLEFPNTEGKNKESSPKHGFLTPAPHILSKPLSGKSEQNLIYVCSGEHKALAPDQLRMALTQGMLKLIEKEIEDRKTTKSSKPVIYECWLFPDNRSIVITGKTSSIKMIFEPLDSEELLRRYIAHDLKNDCTLIFKRLKPLFDLRSAIFNVQTLTSSSVSGFLGDQ